jgi:hypothetical protein
VGTAIGAFGGWLAGEVAVYPYIVAANMMATFATLSSGFAEAKAGTSGAVLVVSGGSQGILYDYSATVSPEYVTAVSLTTAGWSVPTAGLSLAIQSAALANDLGVNYGVPITIHDTGSWP